MSLPWPMAREDPENVVPCFRPLCSYFPASLPGLKPGPSLPGCGALGTTLTFLDPTFCIRKTQKVVRVKLDRTHKMFGTVPSASVKKAGTGIIVRVPALPLTCCVILGKFLPLSGPKSPRASSSLWVTAKNPEMLGKEET